MFDELVESVKQAGEIVRGERAPSREFFVDAAMVKQLRKSTWLDTWPNIANTEREIGFIEPNLAFEALKPSQKP